MPSEAPVSARDMISARNGRLVALQERLADLKGSAWARLGREFEQGRSSSAGTIMPVGADPLLLEAIAIQDRAIAEAGRVLNSLTHRDWRERTSALASLIETARLDAGDRVRAARPDGPTPRF